MLVLKTPALTPVKLLWVWFSEARIDAAPFDFPILLGVCGRSLVWLGNRGPGSQGAGRLLGCTATPLTVPVPPLRALEVRT